MVLFPSLETANFLHVYLPSGRDVIFFHVLKGGIEVVSNRPGVSVLHTKGSPFSSFRACLGSSNPKLLHISLPASLLNKQVLSPHGQVAAKQEIKLLYLKIQARQWLSCKFSISRMFVAYSIFSGGCNGTLCIVMSMSLSFFHRIHCLLFGQWFLEPHLQVERSSQKSGTLLQHAIQSTHSPVDGWGFV